jgi:hypothetical protein
MVAARYRGAFLLNTAGAVVRHRPRLTPPGAGRIIPRKGGSRHVRIALEDVQLRRGHVRHVDPHQHAEDVRGHLLRRRPGPHHAPVRAHPVLVRVRRRGGQPRVRVPVGPHAHSLGPSPALAVHQRAAAGRRARPVLRHPGRSRRHAPLRLGHALLHLHGHDRFAGQCELRRPVPRAVPHQRGPCHHQRPAAGLPARGHDHQHRPHPDGHEGPRVRPDLGRVRHPRRRGHPLHGRHEPRGAGAG